MAHNDHRRSRWPILVRQEIPPDDRRHSKHTEEIGRYEQLDEAFRVVWSIGANGAAVLNCDDGVERRLLIAPEQIVTGVGRLAWTTVRRAACDKHQPIGTRIRKRPKQDSINDAEHG